MGDQAWLIKTAGARAFYCIVLVMQWTSLSMKDRQTDRPTDRRKKEEQKKVKRKRVKEERATFGGSSTSSVQQFLVQRRRHRKTVRQWGLKEGKHNSATWTHDMLKILLEVYQECSAKCSRRLNPTGVIYSFSNWFLFKMPIVNLIGTQIKNTVFVKLKKNLK